MSAEETKKHCCSAPAANTDERREKVERLKREVRSGSYVLNLRELARTLLQKLWRSLRWRGGGEP